MKRTGGKDMDTEGLALIRVSPTDQCRAAWTAVCNSRHGDEAALFLEALGLTPNQAKRGQRLAAGYVRQ